MKASHDFNYPVYYVYSYDSQNCRLLQKKMGIHDLPATQALNIGANDRVHMSGDGAFGIIYIKKN